MECLKVSIGRNVLGLPDLILGEAAPYLFDGKSGGTQAVQWAGDSWSRRMAASPWVNGEHMVGARKQNSDIRLNLWITAPTFPDIRAAYDELKAALEQFTFTVTVHTATVDYAYQGWVADTSLDFDRNHLWNLAAYSQCEIPVMPT